MSEIHVTVAESLECDGVSISASDAAGKPLPVCRVSERRQFRTAYVTWAITLPDSEEMT